MRFDRRSLTAKYPYLATENKQIQTTAQVIGMDTVHPRRGFRQAMLSQVFDWIITLGFVFGGCCR